MKAKEYIIILEWVISKLKEHPDAYLDAEFKSKINSAGDWFYPKVSYDKEENIFLIEPAGS